jgi:hypothetical protein
MPGRLLRHAGCLCTGAATPLTISHVANVNSNTNSGNHTNQVTGDDHYLLKLRCASLATETLDNLWDGLKIPAIREQASAATAP